MTVDARDLAEALTGVMAMLDDKSHGIKASVLVKDKNDCGCHCCDDDDGADQITVLVKDILESAAATNARRILSRWEWAR